MAKGFFSYFLLGYWKGGEMHFSPVAHNAGVDHANQVPYRLSYFHSDDYKKEDDIKFSVKSLSQNTL